jgi:hypothetical protein
MKNFISFYSDKKIPEMKRKLENLNQELQSEYGAEIKGC